MCIGRGGFLIKWIIFFVETNGFWYILSRSQVKEGKNGLNALYIAPRISCKLTKGVHFQESYWDLHLTTGLCIATHDILLSWGGLLFADVKMHRKYLVFEYAHIMTVHSLYDIHRKILVDVFVGIDAKLLKKVEFLRILKTLRSALVLARPHPIRAIQVCTCFWWLQSDKLRSCQDLSSRSLVIKLCMQL